MRYTEELTPGEIATRTGAAIGTSVSGSSNVTVTPGRAATVTLAAPASAAWL